MNRTVLDLVTVTPNGHLQVRLRREIVEDATGEVQGFAYQRTTIQVGADYNAVLATLNAALAKDSGSTIQDADWQRVRDIATATWTPAVVQAWAALQAAAMK